MKKYKCSYIHIYIYIYTPIVPRRSRRRRTRKVEGVDFAYVLSRIKLILNYIMFYNFNNFSAIEFNDVDGLVCWMSYIL